MTQPVSRDSSFPSPLTSLSPLGPPLPPSPAPPLSSDPLGLDLTQPLLDGGAPVPLRLTPRVVGSVGGVASSDVAARLDQFLASGTPTFQTDEGPVRVSIGFYMAGNPIDPQSKAQLDQVLSGLGITGHDRDLLLMGKGTPSLVARATQGLIDAHFLPRGDPQRERRASGRACASLMSRYGLGLDCAAYTIGAVSNVRGISPVAAGFKIESDGLYTLGARGYQSVPSGAPLKPGDIVCLHGSTGSPSDEHRVVVRDCQPVPWSVVESSVPPSKDSLAARGDDAWERVQVDSSWGNYGDPQQGGVSRETWWHDRTTGTWVSSQRGTALTGDVPYGHAWYEVFPPQGCPVTKVFGVCILLACAACGRPSPRSAAPVAVAAGEVESVFDADAAPPTIRPSDALPPAPQRIGSRALAAPDTRDEVPILYERGDVAPAFARAAPPSTAHPRGTIAVEVRLFDGPGSTHGHHDATLLEVDLATAAHVRTVDLGKDWVGSFLFDGASGPIVVLWRSPTVELYWFDRSLVQTSHRSLTGMFSDPKDSYLVRREAVGDRVVFAFADGETRTSIWIVDGSGTVSKRTCPARWRPEADVLENGDDVVVEPIGGDDGFLLCAVRAGGTGKVRTESYHDNARVIRADRRAYFSVNYDDDAGLRLPPGLYPVGSDLRPVLPSVRIPTPPELDAAAARGLYDLPTVVNGIVVLVRSPCCGNAGPFVWLWDPGSIAEGGAP